MNRKQGTSVAEPLLYRVAWKYTASGRTGHGPLMTESEAREWARPASGGNPKVRKWVERKPENK